MPFLPNNSQFESGDQWIPACENEFLHGLIDSLPDAALVTSPSGRLLCFNRRFAEIWNLPDKVRDSLSGEAALHWAVNQVAEPKAFLARITEMSADPFGPSSRDEISMRDGRLFDSYCGPIHYRDIEHFGSLWIFRDVSAPRESEQAIRRADLSFGKPCERKSAWAHRDRTHVVQFYESDRELMNSLVDYAGEGLRKREKVVIIATPEHRVALGRELLREGIDLDGFKARGAYLALDAAETMAKFMKNGMPDEESLFEAMEPVVANPGTIDRPIRIFGEMVALLQTVGNAAGAIRLEELWNELGRRHAFSLFCAYPIQSFWGAANEAHLRSICCAHDRIIPSNSFSDERGEREREISITLLRQRALSSGATLSSGHIEDS